MTPRPPADTGGIPPGDDPPGPRTRRGHPADEEAEGHDELLREFVTDLLDAGREARFIARGHSMHPAIRDGDAVVVAPLAERPPRPGEICLALLDLPGGDRGILLHRLARVLSDGRFLLQGDAVARPDPPVPPDRLVGRLREVSRGGRRWRADRVPGRWLLATGGPLPRCLARLSRLRARLRGGAAVPRIISAPVRRVRERWLLELALGRCDAFDPEEPSAPIRLEPEERDLAPLIFFRLREEELVPEEHFDDDAARAEIEAVCRSAEAEAACLWIGERLHGAGLAACLTKGAALAWELYPAPQTRPAADIDLLVGPPERRAAVEALLAGGAALAEPEYGLSHYLRFGNEVALRLPVASWPVAEIHWRGGGGSCSPATDPERFRQAAVPGRFGPGLLRMSPEAHFVYCVQHLGKHFPALRLLWALDLVLLAERVGDWEEVSEWLESGGEALAAAAVIQWMDDLLPGTVPDGVQRRMLDGARSAGPLRRFCLSHAGGIPIRFAAAWRHPDPATRLAHLRRLLLPGRRTLERMFPGPRRSLLTLQALRLARLLRFGRR